MSQELEPPASREQCLDFMSRTLSPPIQVQLRKHLPRETYFADIAGVYLANPFFQLTDEEVAYFARSVQHDQVSSLMVARETARRTDTPRYAVFCMPKSGSSFLSTTLQASLGLPAASVTGVGLGAMHSIFGMNSREQEIDEFALVKAILTSPDGFVTQTHTRYSMYLGLQMRQFQFTVFVTVRNILDCIVSFDDMMRDWRGAGGPEAWTADAQFALPIDYPERGAATRYDILARSFGVWLIAFYLSWKRCQKQSFIRPIMVRYEEQILNTERLLELLTRSIAMTPEQFGRLFSYVNNPDRERSRLNVGVAGRGGERVPEGSVEFLLDYARKFAPEISEDEVRYLIR